jgi:hypothetical protein
LEKLKHNNQLNHAQIILNTNQNNDSPNAQVQQLVATPFRPNQIPIGINLNEIVNNENVRLDRNDAIGESNNYYASVRGDRNSDIYFDTQPAEFNLVNETVQLPIELNVINLNQQLFNFESGQSQNTLLNSQRVDGSQVTKNNNKRRARSQNGLSQGEKRFVCEHCNKEFKLKQHLTRYLFLLYQE